MYTDGSMAVGQSGRYDYRRDDALRRIRVTVRAPLDTSEFLGIIDRQAAEGTWTFGMICDLRAVDEPPPPNDMAQFFGRVLTHTKVLGQRGPVALVTRERRMIARSQSYATHAATRGHDVEVFWDLDEAEDWLQGSVAERSRAKG
jgi:hypothetical protein